MRCDKTKWLGLTPAAMTRFQVPSERSLMMLAEVRKEAIVKDDLKLVDS